MGCEQYVTVDVEIRLQLGGPLFVPVFAEDPADEIAELRSNGAVDDFDVASINTDSNLEYSISLKQRIEYQKIEKALKKIENGSYGICEECEEPINLERLKAKPHASLCISCRELSEKRQ